MAALLRHVERYHHEMSDADGDVLVAAGAEVLLARLEGVDEGDFEVVVVLVAQPSSAHSTSRITTTKAAITIA